MADQYYELATPGVLGEIIDGEVVAIHRNSGRYFSITGSGTIIWQCLEQSATAAEIAALLGESGTVAPLEAIQAFIDQLKAADLARVAATPRPAELEIEPPADYVAPGLESYSDLDDLLLLDPIHEVDEQGWPHTPIKT